MVATDDCPMAADGWQEGVEPTHTALKPKLRLELPFIQYFRKEAYASALTPSLLRAIPELDREYHHVQTAKAALLSAANSMLRGDNEPEELIRKARTALRSSDSLVEVHDIEAWLTHQVEMRPGAAAAEAAAAAAAAGPRKPMKRGLYYAARKGGAASLMEKFGLSVAELSANLCTHYRQELLPIDDMLKPLEAAQVIHMPYTHATYACHMHMLKPFEAAPVSACLPTP